MQATQHAMKQSRSAATGESAVDADQRSGKESNGDNISLFLLCPCCTNAPNTLRTLFSVCQTPY
jgi:hypothetical protein